MADKKISQLDSVSSVSSGAYFPISQSGSTYKGTTDQIGEQIAKNQDFSELNTTSKKVIGAINEVLADSDKDIISSIDTPAPIITFNNGGDNIPVNKLLVAVTAQQAGTGTPSPSNPRAITGWSGAKITRCGANLSDEEWELGTINDTTGQPASSDTQIRTKNFVGCKGGVDYYLKVTSNNAIRIFWYDSTQAFISQTGNITATVVSAPSNACFFKMRGTNSYGTTYLNDISLNYPSTDTSYHSYKGITVVIPFGDTYYGGTLDVTNGKLTVTRGIVDMGDLTYTSEGTLRAVGKNTIQSVTGLNPKRTSTADCLCSVDELTQTTNQIRFTTITTPEADMPTTYAGQKIVFELETPVVINLTPEQIATLSGLNNIYADCGDIQLLEYFNENADELAELNRAMSDDFHIYSTAEQVVGKWLGEDLYEKSYHYTQATVPAQNTAVTIDGDTSGLNIKSIATFFCTYKIHHISGNYDQWITDSTSTTQINNNQLLFSQKATSAQQNYNNLEVNITIRYTKAS